MPAALKTTTGWSIAWPEACPWVLGRTIAGLRNGPSPPWLQQRLTSIGLRPISALVDVTNFFTFDLGRPLHVFDADRLDGATLTLRRGAGETFRTLAGRDLTTHPDDLVIADATRVVSLAGIIGGEATGTNAETTRVFVECALFDPVITARTGRRHQLASDARQRFERGIDPALLPDAMEAATAMILSLCGGQPGSVVAAGAEPAWQRQASLRYERLAGLGGAAIEPARALAVLEQLGFTPARATATQVSVHVPSWRNDVASLAALDQPASLEPARAAAAAAGAAALEPECDLIEEVLRIVGLDAIPAVSLPGIATPPRPALSPRQARTALARRVLAARGMAECVGFSLTSGAQARLFGGGAAALTLKNPIAADLDQMRPTPLATLAQAAARNAARGAGQANLFEVGPGYTPDGQMLIAAGLRTGTPARHWQQDGARDAALQAKADVYALLGALGVPMDALSVTPDAPSHYHPGRSGVVRQGPRTVLAQFGTIHPALADALGCSPEPAAGFELFLDAIADPKRRRRAAPILPPLQEVARDFAFVLPASQPAEAVLRAARGADRALIARVSLFDVFEGGTLPPGTKSLGIEVVFQPAERTMTDDDLETASAKVIQAVAKATGAQLR